MTFNELLGLVDVWCMILQQPVWFLDKAERLWCGYSHERAITQYKSHTGAALRVRPESTQLFVARYLHRMTMLHASRRDLNGLS